MKHLRFPVPSVDWADIEQWEDEHDYKAGYDLAVAGKPLPRWANEACRDGHEEGQHERQARRERAQADRSAQRREDRLHATVAPVRPGIAPFVAGPSVLRKRG